MALDLELRVSIPIRGTAIALGATDNHLVVAADSGLLVYEIGGNCTITPLTHIAEYAAYDAVAIDSNVIVTSVRTSRLLRNESQLLLYSIEGSAVTLRNITRLSYVTRSLAMKGETLVSGGGEINGSCRTSRNGVSILSVADLQFTLEGSTSTSCAAINVAVDGSSAVALVMEAELRGHPPTLYRIDRSQTGTMHVDRLGHTADGTAIAIGAGTIYVADGGRGIGIPPVRHSVAVFEPLQILVPTLGWPTDLDLSIESNTLFAGNRYGGVWAFELSDDGLTILGAAHSVSDSLGNPIASVEYADGLLYATQLQSVVTTTSGLSIFGVLGRDVIHELEFESLYAEDLSSPGSAEDLLLDDGVAYVTSGFLNRLWRIETREGATSIGYLDMPNRDSELLGIAKYHDSVVVAAYCSGIRVVSAEERLRLLDTIQVDGCVLDVTVVGDKIIASTVEGRVYSIERQLTGVYRSQVLMSEFIAVRMSQIDRVLFFFGSRESLFKNHMAHGVAWNISELETGAQGAQLSVGYSPEYIDGDVLGGVGAYYMSGGRRGLLIVDRATVVPAPSATSTALPASQHIVNFPIAFSR